jgi:Baseplate J-like protein
MALTIKTFAQLVQDQAAAVQARAAQILDFTTGSVMRALTESNAAVALWLQGIALQILTRTRLSTSTGSDVDTWVNDWGVTRLAATVASGSVTFSRFTPQALALIPLGAQVQTADGSQVFQVVLDAANAVWSASQNAYVLQIGVASATIPVQSVNSSTSANVAANTINVLLTNVVGVDTVTNALLFTGGSNSETDEQLRSRFVSYIGSLSKGTIAAVLYAVRSLQLGLNCTVLENVDPSGNTVYSYMTITVDDGTGVPPQSLLNTVGAAINNVRAGGVQMAVVAPTITTITVSCVIVTATGYDRNVLIGTVNAALTSYLTSLTVGQGLSFYRLSQVIYDATPGITTVSSLVLNGATADIAANPRAVIKLTSLAVS